jgi:hypothetical protein
VAAWLDPAVIAATRSPMSGPMAAGLPRFRRVDAVKPASHVLDLHRAASITRTWLKGG